MAAYDLLADYGGDVLVINGDMPLIRESSLRALLELHRREANDCTVLTYYESGELPPFGRVLRGADGRVCDIREYKDANESERAVRELNGGIYVFDCKKLFDCLQLLEPARRRASITSPTSPSFCCGAADASTGFACTIPTSSAASTRPTTCFWSRKS